MRTSTRRWVAAVTALACCLSMAAVPVSGGGEAQTRTGPNPCAGTVTESANGTTVISVQGFRYGDEGGKRPAKLVGVGPSGEIEWVYNSTAEHDAKWGYDVDPMANGNVFVTTTARSEEGEQTVVYEFDPDTQERVWTERFDLADTHDADLINDGEEILLANMRNYNETSGENEDRIFVYNRTTEEIEWEWQFDDHYDRAEMAENYTDDWTHVNDVDKVADGEYLVSPRNFDQVILVNRSTNEIDMQLGADEEYDTLRQQHNPDYLESEDGTPTFIVADSENDRLVEYAREGEREWSRTWSLGGDLAWPRDADRLADGDTLVTDSANHRVAEVTPEGEVVWEFYAPWLVYDAARLSQPNESGGPTAGDLNATGSHEIAGGSDRHENDSALEACDRELRDASGSESGTGTGGAGGDTATEAASDETEESALDAGTTETDDESTGGVPGFGPVAALAAALIGVGLAGRQNR